jgi:hypothetical protein
MILVCRIRTTMPVKRAERLERVRDDGGRRAGIDGHQDAAIASANV